MAKRNPPRSQSNGGAAAAPARPKARRSQAVTTSTGSGPSEEDIRRRAYQRYVDRGGKHGMDFEDWLQAERELKKSRD
jgi:hypothetical protein